MRALHRLRQQERDAQASDVGGNNSGLHGVPDGSECLMPPDDDKASTSRPECLGRLTVAVSILCANCKALAAAAHG